MRKRPDPKLQAFARERGVKILRPACKHVDDGLGYIAWHEDAARRMKRSEKQRRCPVCKLWRWDPAESAPGGETGRTG